MTTLHLYTLDPTCPYCWAKFVWILRNLYGVQFDTVIFGLDYQVFKRYQQ